MQLTSKVTALLANEEAFSSPLACVFRNSLKKQLKIESHHSFLLFLGPQASPTKQYRFLFQLHSVSTSSKWLHHLFHWFDSIYLRNLEKEAITLHSEFCWGFNYLQGKCDKRQLINSPHCQDRFFFCLLLVWSPMRTTSDYFNAVSSSPT